MPNKPDTQIRVIPSTSATADLGPLATNLSSATGGAYEATSARLAIGTSAREVSATFDADSGSSGVILYHGNTALSAYGYALLMSSGVLTFQSNAVAMLLVTPPGISGSLQSFTAQLCTRANPLTTGASDAFVTEALVINNDTGAQSVTQLAHADAAVSASHNFSLGGIYNGTATLVNQYTDPIDLVRIGSRFHATAEGFEDFTAGASFTGTGAIVSEPLCPMPAAIVADTNFAGPAYIQAGAQVKASARRLASPIVNAYSPHARPVGGWYAVADEISGALYPYQGGAAAFGDGPGGALDRARDFEHSSNQHAFVADSALGALLTNGASDFTVSCWVKPESYPSATEWIFAALTSGVNNSAFILWVNSSGKLNAGWETSGSYSTAATSTSSIGTGSWVHLAVSCTHAAGTRTVSMAINGSTDGTGSQAEPTHSPSNIYLLGAPSLSRGFDGLVGEIKVEAGDQLVAATGTGARNVTFEAGRDTGTLNPIQPLAWWRFHTPADGYEPARNFAEVTLGTATYKAHANHYWRRPVGPMFSQAKVRVVCSMTFVGAGTSDAIDVALVSSTQTPGQFILSGQPSSTNYTSETIAAAASSADYVLEFDDALDLAVGPDGLTHLYIATRMGSGTAATGDTYFAIKSVHVIPYQPTPSASLPLSPGS